MQHLRISLVMSTVGRKDDIARFCASLEEQTYRDFELIVVDQSGSDEIAGTIGHFSDKYPIIHLRSERGLSRGRNVGMQAATGDVIGFPDDDCWYKSQVLERVAAAFHASPAIDVLSGVARDESGAAVGRWDRRSGTITRNNVWRRANSVTIFMRRHVTEAVGGFDELLGAGSDTPFGSGEETDFLIRAVDLSFRSRYDPTLVISHPNKKYTDFGIERSFRYGAGMGFVFAKNRSAFMNVLGALFRPIIGMIIWWVAGKGDRARYHLATAKGRCWGYMEGRRITRNQIGSGDRRRVGPTIVGPMPG